MRGEGTPPTRSAHSRTLLVFPTAAALRPFTAVEQGASEHANRENTKIDNRRRRVNRVLGRYARNRKLEIKWLRVVHADVEHDKEQREKSDGLDDGLETHEPASLTGTSALGERLRAQLV